MAIPTVIKDTLSARSGFQNVVWGLIYAGSSGIVVVIARALWALDWPWLVGLGVALFLVFGGLGVLAASRRINPHEPALRDMRLEVAQTLDQIQRVLNEGRWWNAATDPLPTHVWDKLSTELAGPDTKDVHIELAIGYRLIRTLNARALHAEREAQSAAHDFPLGEGDREKLTEAQQQLSFAHNKIDEHLRGRRDRDALRRTP